MPVVQSISFCITCKNRLRQIKKTLGCNFNYNWIHQPLIKFVLVDFGSNDGLQNGVLSTFAKDLEPGYLKYFYTDELPLWHSSVAKNTAHLLAQNEIVVNLDCDNYTGFCGAGKVIRAFQKDKSIIFHQFSGSFNDGSYGRIAVGKKHFVAVGGYDESFYPMGYQDADLVNRLAAIGLRYISYPNSKYSKAIPNSKEEGLKHSATNLDYQTMNRLNSEKSKRNISKESLWQITA
jgi:glycosyltransferase involved in cell wall biosynthesis